MGTEIIDADYLQKLTCLYQFAYWGQAVYVPILSEF